jgi:hypothetical protein
MSMIDIIADETAKLGYRPDAVRRDYSYSDVWSSSAATRAVPFVAFTQTPPSYRSAAFAAVQASEGDPAAAAASHRALGAPFFFVIEADTVSVWQVYANKATPPRFLGRFTQEELPACFFEHKEIWAPDVIHRAKSIGRIDTGYQLDFVDIGLIPAIEGEIHTKLDRLIRDAIAGTRNMTGNETVRLFFQGVFRLLAAKILTDRNHTHAAQWNANDVASVLSAMGDFYNLGNASGAWPRTTIKQLAPVWATFRSGFNVANISADDLAFVYESTLVTDKARANFATHSTPRHVADYIVGKLRLWKFGDSPPRVYEPFTGAGVFLGSALRHMRDGLPHDWSDERRHELLVKHIGGAELDPFACEVAKLSLILADYPNKNGWTIEETDLFKKDALASRLSEAQVILCNPPFPIFDDAEKLAYPEASRIDGSKAVFALETALRAQPDMLGFVVPNTLLVDRRYRAQRELIEQLYREIEMVSLPDCIFNKSQAYTALLIARDRLQPGDKQTIRSSDVLDSDKRRFAVTGQPSRIREEVREPRSSQDGTLWLWPLGRVWKALANRPKLGELMHGHWGLRWKKGQKGRDHDRSGPGRRLGFMNSSVLNQYIVANPRWLDTGSEQIYGGGNWPWEAPKILCNAGRLGRGYWQLAAAVDRDGMRASQQFIAWWPQKGNEDLDLDAMAALLNGPVINAFLTERSFDKRFRIGALDEAPIPYEIPAELGDLSRAYALATRRAAPDSPELAKLLKQIDEIVLGAYQLPTELESDLLDAMMNGERPLSGPNSRRRRIGNRPPEPSSDYSEIGPLFAAVNEPEIDVGEDFGDEVPLAERDSLLRSITKPIPITEWAGAVMSSAELADVMSVEVEQLLRWRKMDLVVALEDVRGERVYPVQQFVEGQPVIGLKEIVGLIGNARVAWLWLRQPHALLDRKLPLDALKSGGLQEVLRVAARDFS